jgi:pyridoxamine 5'-phosphate oxidase
MPIDPASLDPDPIRQLAAWLAEAEASGLPLPNAFALATCDADGTPSVRMLLLRGLDADGLRFFTNTASRKGRDLAANPRGAAAFWWPGLDRQVRLAGEVRPLPHAESLAYWATRPRASQLSAWASDQGREVASREALEARVAEVAARFGDSEMPLPPFWGGYLLAPETIEFWESRVDRLHDRVEYHRRPDGAWRAARLQP